MNKNRANELMSECLKFSKHKETKDANIYRISESGYNYVIVVKENETFVVDHRLYDDEEDAKVISHACSEKEYIENMERLCSFFKKVKKGVKIVFSVWDQENGRPIDVNIVDEEDLDMLKDLHKNMTKLGIPCYLFERSEDGTDTLIENS